MAEHSKLMRPFSGYDSTDTFDGIILPELALWGLGKMNLPEIGDIVTTKEALELCRYFGLDYLIERIESAPGRYKVFNLCG